MKDQKLDGVEVWKQLEDVLAPRFKLSVLDRAVYSHLLRHTCLEGKLRLRFSIVWLAGNLGITSRRARQSVRRLVDIGALHLIERSNIGHVVDVRLPQQLCAAHPDHSACAPSMPPGGPNLEQLDFWRTRPLRLAIHAREAGLCFYCLRHTPAVTTAWTMSSRSPRAGPIPTAISFLAAWTATLARGTSPPPTFCDAAGKLRPQVFSEKHTVISVRAKVGTMSVFDYRPRQETGVAIDGKALV